MSLLDRHAEVVELAIGLAEATDVVQTAILARLKGKPADMEYARVLLERIPEMAKRLSDAERKLGL